MILGIGSDIIDITRIEKLLEKSGDQFKERTYTSEELEAADKYSDSKKYASFLAKRFAAKEAIAKALGTGIGENIAFKEASITNLKTGKPIISLTGNAAKTLKNLTPEGKIAKIDISLSDDYPMAQAFVVISAD